MAAQQQMQAQQMQAQQMAMMAQQDGQPPQQPPQPDPEMLKMLEMPSWEDIQAVMQNDMMREYRIDIETDSTIQAQQQGEQRNITELLSGITDFMNGVAGPVQSGVLTLDAAKQMLLAAVRRFKLGRVVEDSIEDIEAPEAQQGPQGIPEEQVQQQMQQVQQQAEQQIKQVTQQSMQQAKEAEQKAMGMAKEAEQRAMQKAQEAERNAKFYEMQRKGEMDAVIKTAQQELATERARNKIAELSMTLKYDQKIFDLEKNLDAHRKQVDDQITTAIEEEKNAEQVTVVVEEI
jgi:hypothetical protein